MNLSFDEFKKMFTDDEDSTVKGSLVSHKVFVANYSNGEDGEYLCTWTGKGVHRTKQGCEKEILDLGYVLGDMIKLDGEPIRQYKSSNPRYQEAFAYINTVPLLD